MHIVPAKNNVSQTGGLVCGYITLYAAYVSTYVPMHKWTPDIVAGVVTHGVQRGKSIGGIIDEDYAKEVHEFSLNVTDKYIADGIADKTPIDVLHRIVVGTRSDAMMALTTCAPTDGSVGHHMFIAFKDNTWYWLESLTSEKHKAAYLRVFESKLEFIVKLYAFVRQKNWSLRGISKEVKISKSG